MVRKLRINESEVFGSSGRLTDTCTFKFLNDVDGSDRYTNEKSGSRYRILYKGQPIMQVVNWNEHSDDIDELGTVDVEVMYDADDLPINYMSDNFFEQYDSWEDLVDSLKALDKFDKQPSNESLRRINESNDFDDAFIDKLWDACYNVSGLEDIDYDSSSNSNIIFTYGQTTNDYDQREQELISALENSGYNSKYVTNNGSNVIVLRLNAEVNEATDTLIGNFDDASEDQDFYGVYFTEFDRDNMFLFETEKDANNALYELQDFSEYLESISENDLSLDSDEYDSRLENILISNNAGDVDILGIVINSDGTAKISTPVEELSCKVINSDPVDLSY